MPGCSPPPQSRTKLQCVMCRQVVNEYHQSIRIATSSVPRAAVSVLFRKLTPLPMLTLHGVVCGMQDAVRGDHGEVVSLLIKHGGQVSGAQGGGVLVRRGSFAKRQRHCAPGSSQVNQIVSEVA